jgi:hypothetical protein
MARSGRLGFGRHKGETSPAPEALGLHEPCLA